MAESAILRTEKNVKRTNQEEQSAQIAMAKLYLYHAVDTVEQKGKESIISFAEGDEQRMMLMAVKSDACASLGNRLKTFFAVKQ